MENTPLDNIQQDQFSEFLAIGYSEISERLSTFLNKDVTFEAPKWLMCPETNAEKLVSEMPETSIIINQSFHGQYNGSGFLVIEKQDAIKMAAALLGEPVDKNTKLNADHKDVLKEIGNITINGLICSADNYLDDQHDFSVPTCILGMPKNLLNIYEYSNNAFPILVVHANFKIGPEETKVTFGLMIEQQGIERLSNKLQAKYPNS